MSESIAQKRARSAPKPHPNQVRSACERCRRQKLRCLRQITTPSSSSSSSSSSSADGDEEATQDCVRCARLGLPCVSGPQRRVGRPSRREASIPASTVSQQQQQQQQALPILSEESPRSSSLPENLTINTHAFTFFDSLDNGLLELDAADTAGEFQWTTANSDSVFDFLDIDLLNTPPCSDNNSSIILHHQGQVSSAFDRTDTPLFLPVSASTAQFASLSKINVRLHSVWNTLSSADASPGRLTMKTLIEGFCMPKLLDDGTTWNSNALLDMLTLLQEYLVTVKELHRTLTLNMRNTSSFVLQKSSDSASFAEEQQRQRDRDQPLLDSPTAFLVISCFHQIVRCFELSFKVVNSSLSPDQTAVIAFPSPLDVSLAGVKILEFSSQGVMYTELARHVLRQVYAILGLPQADAPHARTMPNGLLSGSRYMEILNTELGGGKGSTDWASRPAKLLESLDVCIDLFLQRSMACYG